ncbi:LeuA family protein [Pendulispora rubella]|uniref:LeuA family protein n=1 Tax=Pendulispora rubella TaxID=2741070 RepID=A0ABZ2KVY7_9BACT
MDESRLIFDWNELEPRRRFDPAAVSLFDETLRDGLQNPSVIAPAIEEKLEILHAMNDLGIHAADIGLPASSPRAFDDCLRICREVERARLPIKVACAGRTMVGDIMPMIELSQRAGIPIEVYAFIGSSPIRQYAEDWDVDLIVRRSVEAIDAAVDAGLEVAYVTEDTTRSRPETLRLLFREAIEHGASRICLSDTVGHATPDGVQQLVRFTKEVIAETGVPNIGIDWHGHNDRGLALENCVRALDCGVDRVHATALGIGERVGNVPMELLLMNMKLLGLLDRDLTPMIDYVETVARAVGWSIPINYPLVGRDAFRTATGVHAAAIIKAMGKGDSWLADRIYSGVPAGVFGRSQEICVGAMSGASNVLHWLRKHDIAPSEELVTEILKIAKTRDHILTDEELLAIAGRPERHSRRSLRASRAWQEGRDGR